MKEVFESVISNFKERFQNRFIGTFLLIFLALNWKKEMALFYVKDMKYAEAVSALSLDDNYFYCLIFRSVLYSLVYLFFAPWLSYVVHLFQSKPVYMYKELTIRKNTALEERKKELLALTEENVKKKQKLLNMKNKNKDEEIFDRLMSEYTEQDLVSLLELPGDEANLFYGKLDKLKRYLVSSNVVDNQFVSEPIKSLQQSSIEKLSELFKVLDKNKFFLVVHKDSPNAQVAREDVEKISAGVLKEYRAFRRFKFD